ncbi:hypothetical protein EG68_04434 [Paragonimus skrjabini miyazakii]|uniref:GYF domain-containing protein n=1 Tax=Paragonimus skrjabini miyazakii TaxID=59628 RepID=A0A8S9YTR6_9TREM|nr:hypothetical protein EG68_04434 [Paragonimus skrjabini miyazakii]
MMGESLRSSGQRLRYSREEVIACKEAASLINFHMNPIVVKAPRSGRKKSQSNETEVHKLSSGSHEDLVADDVDQTAQWHRAARQQWLPGNSSSHSRQRYPSGPHGDVSQIVSHTPLRPLPADTRRGGHGNWSKGCAGWRQRSYSGSENSGLGQSTHINYRGRGAGTNAHSIVESDEHVFRGRGRSRPGGRYVFQLRGPSVREQHAGQGALRLNNFVSTLNRSIDTEEFWQDEDWNSMSLDHESHSPHTSTSREMTDVTRPFVDMSTSTCITATTTTTLKPHSLPVIPGPPMNDTEKLTKASELPTRSSSHSLDPPPGFDLPPQLSPNNTSPQNRSTDLPDTAGSSGTGLSIDTAVSRWYYVDSMGQTQGPFTNQQMAAWLAGGYLPLSIEIRRDCDECFLTLIDHMNLAGRLPFWDGYVQPPITQSNLTSLGATLGKPISNPRWLSNIPPPTSAPISPFPQASHFPLLIGNSHHAPSTSTVANSAAAAAATAVLIATAATLASQQQTQYGVPDRLQAPSAQAELSLGNSSSLPTPSLVGGDHIMRLYTEAQALAAHVAKVEAERQELVDRLAAINSSAVKLLSPNPTANPTVVGASVPEQLASLRKDSLPLQKVVEVTETKEAKSPYVCSETVIVVEPSECPSSLETNAQALLTVGNKSVTDDSLPVEHESQREHTISTLVSVPTETDEPELASDTRENGRSSLETSVADVANKKSKKKNKKTKKSKLTPEQERQLAWEAEFERRKAVARERTLAQEAEARRLAEEEAAAIAEEQSALAKEQARLLNEQRKRELARVKADQQLGNLQLPSSARWAVSAGAISADSPSGGPTSLAVIQAAQAREEAERKRREAFMAEQAMALSAAELATITQRTPQAWASVVNTTSAGAVKQKQQPTAAKTSKTLRPKVDPPIVKASVQPESVKATNSGTNSTSTTKKSHTGPSSTTNAVHTTSIWNLPLNDKPEPAASENKSSKKNKKNAKLNREAASFAAKEQLAHWCESQLSSMPLSGVDLPTLVDLLCELEAAEQVVEFIESSLGRSKRTSKFSKAFLEKRACILNAVL